MAYYHDVVTEQSWRQLQQLPRQIDFILIGGWAVYLYTKALKSKDIDILVDFDQLPKLMKYYQLSKNDRLKKYEAVQGPIQIDVYLPHYSQLGIPVEVLQRQTRPLEGFTVLNVTYLLALKLYTFQQRGRSPKGKKDFIDAIALFATGDIKSRELQGVLTQYELTGAWKHFVAELKLHSSLPELSLNAHAFARLKKRIGAGDRT